MKIIFWYVFILNIGSFLLMGYDKQKAKKHRYRISEHTLFLCAWFGGSIGILCGMLLFHHKTKKKKFQIGIPLILLLHFVLYFILYDFI